MKISMITYQEKTFQLLLFIVLFGHISNVHAIEDAQKEEQKLKEIEKFNKREPQFPSYVGRNHMPLDLCLRASEDLEKGTVVATTDFEQTDEPYIADHPLAECRYRGLIDITPEGLPIYGKVRGKWAFCNHSCDPNCDITDSFEIRTNRFVKKDAELTTSYDALVYNFPWPAAWNFECLCGAPNCKKTIKEYRTDIIYPIKDHRR